MDFTRAANSLKFGGTLDDRGLRLNGLAKERPDTHIRGMKQVRQIVLGCVFGLAFCTTAVAQQFPWEPVAPPRYTPPAAMPEAPTPTVSQPKHLVPGHQSRYGYVPAYESQGPVTPPLAPGEKSKGWVPGYHDNNGAWIPGHPQ